MNTNPEEKLELDTWKLIGSFLDEEKEKNKDALLKIQNKMLL
jgi:hypothetical protein